MRFHLLIISFCFTTIAMGQTELSAYEIVDRGQEVIRVKGVLGVELHGEEIFELRGRPVHDGQLVHPGAGVDLVQ